MYSAPCTQHVITQGLTVPPKRPLAVWRISPEMCMLASPALLACKQPACSTQHAGRWHLWSHWRTFKDVWVRGHEPGGARAGHKRRVVRGGGTPRGIHSKVVVVHDEVAGGIKREKGDKGRHRQVLCHREVEVDSAQQAGHPSVWNSRQLGMCSVARCKTKQASAPCLCRSAPCTAVWWKCEAG